MCGEWDFKRKFFLNKIHLIKYITDHCDCEERPTLMPFDVLLTPNLRPANSASYKYSLSSSLNNWTNMWVRLQLSGSE